MAAIDFKEIVEAHLGGGQQDTFELFARDFLRYLGYSIDEDPNRGADGGKDMVVTEKRVGIGGATNIRWLVSCKHKAHSGSSVTPQDEMNIRDRLEANQCDGFLGIYSTLPSSGLADMLKGMSTKTETQFFDREKIEHHLLKSVEGECLAKRYFPKSIAEWIGEHPKPAKVFTDHFALNCQHCGKDLLVPEPSGIIVIWSRNNGSDKMHHERIYWCCKGSCDQRLAGKMNNLDLSDGWEDIPDVAIPIVFSKWMMAPLNRLYRGDTYSLSAFENLKEFILSVYPYVARNATSVERERIQMLAGIPAYLGGLDY